MTVGVVCESCNNGWMSDLESGAKPYLETMLRGRGRELHEAGLRTLATWALKTSMMVEHMHGAKRHIIPGEEYAHLFEHGEPSEHVRIWMAAYAGSLRRRCRKHVGARCGNERDRAARMGA